MLDESRLATIRPGMAPSSRKQRQARTERKAGKRPNPAWRSPGKGDKKPLPLILTRSVRATFIASERIPGGVGRRDVRGRLATLKRVDAGRPMPLTLEFLSKGVRIGTDFASS
jgi:ribosome assembly protein YihI (activator of Der GTPase)